MPYPSIPPRDESVFQQGGVAAFNPYMAQLQQLMAQLGQGGVPGGGGQGLAPPTGPVGSPSRVDLDLSGMLGAPGRGGEGFGAPTGPVGAPSRGDQGLSEGTGPVGAPQRGGGGWESAPLNPGTTALPRPPWMDTPPAGMPGRGAGGLMSFQRGGVVPGRGPVPILAHGGETVLPTRPNPMGPGRPMPRGPMGPGFRPNPRLNPYSQGTRSGR
jgi:hypothetical protein